MLPRIIEDKLLINADNCEDATQITFKENIPKEIYVYCDNGTKVSGDIYSFEVE